MASMVDEFVDLDDGPDEEIPEFPVYTQVQAWDVITAYFDEKGLVRQQLDSFDQVHPSAKDEFLLRFLAMTLSYLDLFPSSFSSIRSRRSWKTHCLFK
jgi:DNA-directed RNA polymerase beta subunit